MARQQYFDGERDGCHWGLEEPGETGRHARYEQDARSVLHGDFRTDVVAEGGPDLHRDSLASGAPAEQVRNPRGRHDERDEP